MKTQIRAALLFFVSIATAVILPASASAQYNDEKPEPFEYNQFFSKNVIKFNPLGTIFGNYSFAYERVLPNNKISLQLGGSYMQNSIGTSTTVNSTTEPSLSGTYGANLSTVGFSVTPEFRYYYLEDLTKGKYKRPAPYGLYIGAAARYFHNDYVLDIQLPNFNEDIEFVSNFYTLGINGGFHGIIGKHVSVDIYAGPNLNYAAARITKLPQVFDNNSIENIAYNWAIDYLLNELVGSMEASTTFPGVRAGITIGAAF